MSGALRVRVIIDDASRPKMPRHVRLQMNELRDRWVVLAPEKVMWPDPVSVDVLQLCNGLLTLAEIVDKLAVDYNAPPEVIKTDVMEFVQEWTDKRLLLLS
ncbi:MAG: pyrroloquinoline quinone biosynthesis peptide chaperone PqqD [Chitinophagales bacterium]|nr:pyrroloquinoline quinone biosynthesis peptide chaperone PqqD [Hyphomicrobiales bacterium]